MRLCDDCQHPQAAHDADGCDMCIVRKCYWVCTNAFRLHLPLPGRRCWICGMVGIRGFARDEDGRDICADVGECAYRFNLLLRKAFA